MNSTMIGASAKSAGSPAQAGQKFVEANLSEPQRVFYVTELTPAYLEFSAAAYADGRLDVAERTLLTLRSLWLAIEERDPYDYAANVMLSKISSIMVQRGNLEYTQELIDDHSKVVSYFPQYPELVGTAATAAATAGDYELAILFAEKAIEHEPSTRELSRTWYAKGISLFILGFEEQGISDLLNATKKLPDSAAATLAHMALAKIYGDRGDNAKADFHSAEASH